MLKTQSIGALEWLERSQNVAECHFSRGRLTSKPHEATASRSHSSILAMAVTGYDRSTMNIKADIEALRIVQGIHWSAREPNEHGSHCERSTQRHGIRFANASIQSMRSKFRSLDNMAVYFKAQ